MADAEGEDGFVAGASWLRVDSSQQPADADQGTAQFNTLLDMYSHL